MLNRIRNYVLQSWHAANTIEDMLAYARSIGCIVHGDSIQANEEQRKQIKAWLEQKGFNNGRI